MSIANDQPTLSGEHDACPQTVPAAAAEAPPQSVFSAATRILPPRPRKSAVLPEIVRLALEGHSNRAIGRKLGIPRRTVDRWLREQRQEWDKTAEENAVKASPPPWHGWKRSIARPWRPGAAPGRQAGDGRNRRRRRRGKTGPVAAHGNPIGTGRPARPGDPRRHGNLQLPDETQRGGEGGPHRRGRSHPPRTRPGTVLPSQGNLGQNQDHAGRDPQ